MNGFWLSLFVVAAALANAVPSSAALRPSLTACFDLTEEDLTGSGLEARSQARITCALGEEDDMAGDARRWWKMAARARRAADWVSPKDHLLLTRLAEEYEARAKLAEGWAERREA